MTSVLITGFGSFPGVPENVTERLVPDVAEAASRRFPRMRIESAILPVVWEHGPRMARELAANCGPDVVLHFGVSERARGLVVETVAANACRASLDAEGNLPPLDLIDPNLPASGIRVSIPTAAILARLTALGLPAETSLDAGGYLCNAVLFETLKDAPAGRRAGFIHVPTLLLPAAVATEGALSFEDAVRGAVEILAVCLEG